MDAQIQAILEKELSAEAGKVLKNLLEQGEQNAQEVEKLKGVIKEKEQTIKENENMIRDYVLRAIFEDQLNEKEAELAKQEKELKNKERELRIKELEYQLEGEKDKTSFCKNVALGLVRNTEFRKEMFYSNSDQVDGHYAENGNWVGNYNTTKSEEKKETNTAE